MLVFLSIRNGNRAKLKEQSSLTYGLLTALLFIVGEIIGLAFVLTTFCKNINLQSIAGKGPSDPLVQKLAVDLAFDFANNPLHEITVSLFGFGGYLLVRYILDKKPEKKKKLPFWPDQENVQS